MILSTIYFFSTRPLHKLAMRLQLASDLHLEFIEETFPGETLVLPAHDADLLVLAGDIHNGTRAVELFASWPVPVLYVAGNHEFYERHWEQTRADLKAAARGTSVLLMDNDEADLSSFAAWYEPRAEELKKIRFFGTTLWTDYNYHSGRSQQEHMAIAEKRIVDHRVIRTRDGPFRARHALDDHERSRAWLAEQLETPFDGKTVVITHHGPHPLSVHPKYLAPDWNDCNAAFVSDLSGLLPHANLWLHGHVHDSFDYQVDRCRVVANPRGYPTNRRSAERPQDLEFENAAFQQARVVEV